MTKNLQPNQCRIRFNDCIKALEKYSLLVDSQFVSDTCGYIHTNSKNVSFDDIFIAYKGISIDSHHFIKNAITSGAKTIVLDNKIFIDESLSNVNWILVHDSRKAWSVLASLSFDNPQNSLKFIGITGTNGKTSTVWILKEFLRLNNVPFCSIGTLGIWLNDQYIPSNHTTPDPDILFNILRQAVNLGIKYVVMEVSSHSIAQGKLIPLKFIATGFTSFSRDHLDFHRDMDDYFNAKWQLFENFLEPGGFCIFNKDIPLKTEKIKCINSNNLYLYGKNLSIQNPSGLYSHVDIHNQNSNISICINHSLEATGVIPFYGDYNEENFTLAYLIATKCLNLSTQPEKWMMLNQVPGRLQRIKDESLNIEIVVDYAHTPDALEKALSTLKTPHKNLLVIFGCGGNRDKGKRPEMARVAEEFADQIIVTSDNPRHEEPEDIISDIMVGFQDKHKVQSYIDRRFAIKHTIDACLPHSIILIAGKGHETYQIIKDLTLEFDDFKIATQFLTERSKQ